MLRLSASRLLRKSVSWVSRFPIWACRAVADVMSAVRAAAFKVPNASVGLTWFQAPDTSCACLSTSLGYALAVMMYSPLQHNVFPGRTSEAHTVYIRILLRQL